MVGQNAKEDVRLHTVLTVMEDRPLSERRFHIAESLLGAAGFQQIAAVELFGLCVSLRIELRNEGCGLRVVGEPVIARDARITLLQSPNRLVDLLGVDQFFAGDALDQSIDISAQPRLVFGADRQIFADALLAAAEHERVLIIDTGFDVNGGLLLRGIAWRRFPQHRRETVCVLEVSEPTVAFTLTAGNDVVQVARFQRGDVLLIGHAPVDDHRRSCGNAAAFAQAIEHLRERRAMLPVASKDLMGEWKTVTIDDKPNDDLLAVLPMVARFTALRLGIARTQALKIGRGEIVENDRCIEVEQTALARHELGLNGGTVGMQFVQHRIERILIKRIEIVLEDIGQCRAPDPSRHGVLGTGRDQAIERHHAREPPHLLRELTFAQDAVELQPVPKLITDMHRARLSVAFGAHPRRVDFDQRPASARGRGRGALRNVARILTPLASRAAHDIGDFAVVGLKQPALTGQGVLDLAREFEPLFARPRAQVAKRTDRGLARALRCVDGFDQYVVGVGLTLVGACRFANVHASAARIVLLPYDPPILPTINIKYATIYTKFCPSF